MFEDRRKALVVIAGSLAVTGVILRLVFSLSGWAYQQREGSLHDGRLKRLVDQHPLAAQVTAGILAEPGTRALGAPGSEDELRRLAASWRRGDVERMVAKRRALTDVRVFGAGELVYVLYFDAQGRLQD